VSVTECFVSRDSTSNIPLDHLCRLLNLSFVSTGMIMTVLQRSLGDYIPFFAYCASQCKEQGEDSICRLRRSYHDRYVTTSWVYEVSVDQARDVQIVCGYDKVNSWKQYSSNFVCLLVCLITITTLASVVGVCCCCCDCLFVSFVPIVSSLLLVAIVSLLFSVVLVVGGCGHLVVVLLCSV
jgi:hypothetical protein